MDDSEHNTSENPVGPSPLKAIFAGKDPFLQRYLLAVVLDRPHRGMRRGQPSTEPAATPATARGDDE